MLAALLTATLLLFFLCNSAAADPALRPGKWEATVITEMPLSKQPAKQTITQCIEPGNTGPMQKLVQDGNCAIKDKVVEGSSMRWQMECKSRRGATTTGTGRFTSNGDTGAAQIEMTA
ncbi:MAG TPA: DUF3617 family protein, partial [Terriglobales bacterium]|nr:DUF3617 family protein [Terriglobales bacterium]